MLVNLLQSHPAVVCHMEIFHPNRVEGFSGKYRHQIRTDPTFAMRLLTLRERRPASYLYDVAFDAQGRRAAGFKFKYDELLLPQFKKVRSILAHDTDIAIVHLRRRNLLKRYLSWILVNRVTGVSMRTTRDVRPAAPPPVFLDPAACLRDFEETRRRDAQVEELFADHPGFAITYEELTGDNGSRPVAELQKFLGVPTRPLKSVIAKLSPNELAREIANFSELTTALRRTPYSEFLID